MSANPTSKYLNLVGLTTVRHTTYWVQEPFSGANRLFLDFDQTKRGKHRLSTHKKERKSVLMVGRFHRTTVLQSIQFQLIKRPEYALRTPWRMIQRRLDWQNLLTSCPWQPVEKNPLRTRAFRASIKVLISRMLPKTPEPYRAHRSQAHCAGFQVGSNKPAYLWLNRIFRATGFSIDRLKELSFRARKRLYDHTTQMTLIR